MDKPTRVPHVMHCHVRGARERVAIFFRRLPERGRRLFNTLRHRAFLDRKAYVLPRMCTRPV